MKISAAQHGWYAVATLRELKKGKPVRRYLFDTPIVLFWGAEKASALVDRCPHRGAPLSEGKVINGELRCPYHGWQFSGSGRLEKIPCLVNGLPNIQVQSFPTFIQFGLVFVKLGEGPTHPYRNPLHEEIRFWKAVPAQADTDLVESAENFLDPTHTAFVHAHLFQSEKRANLTHVKITGTSNSVEARYVGGMTDGLVSKLFREPKRSLSVGRFIGPCAAEVEFHGSMGVNFVMTGYLTPGKSGHVYGFGVVGLPGPKAWAWTKFRLLLPWMKLINRQDTEVLKNAHVNREHFPNTQNVIGPLDFIRPHIEAILEGKEPPAAKQTVEGKLNL